MPNFIEVGTSRYPTINREVGRHLQEGDFLAARYYDGRTVVGRIIAFGGHYGQTSSPYSTIEIESPPELAGRKYNITPPCFISRVGARE